MDIILGRGGDQGQGHSGGARGQGLFENIKEKAKSVTKRNFLWDYYEQHLTFWYSDTSDCCQEPNF